MSTNSPPRLAGSSTRGGRHLGAFNAPIAKFYSAAHKVLYQNGHDYDILKKMDRNFGGAIWTNHALQRLNERGIKQGDAWATFRRPDQSRYASAQRAWVYYKTYGNTKIEVVAKQNDKREWIILSVWSRPVYENQAGSRPVGSHPMDKILEFLLGRFRKRN